MKFYYKEMEFDVSEDVYYPREDSLLMAKVLEHVSASGKHALEIGCGCGFLSTLLAKKGAVVTATDINPSAVEITKINSKRNKADLTAFVSDMFEKAKGKFDIILFNPPYLPIGEDEDIYSGGSSGREVIELFADGVVEHLNADGIVLIVISSLTGEKEVLDLFGQAGLSARSVMRKKIPWEELIVIMASH